MHPSAHYIALYMFVLFVPCPTRFWLHMNDVIVGDDAGSLILPKPNQTPTTQIMQISTKLSYSMYNHLVKETDDA